MRASSGSGEQGARAEVVSIDGAAQLVEGARFDLAHALPGDAEPLAGLCERPVSAGEEAVAQPEDLFFACGERAQQAVDLLVLELDLDHLLDRMGSFAEILGGQAL